MDNERNGAEQERHKSGKGKDLCTLLPYSGIESCETC